MTQYTYLFIRGDLTPAQQIVQAAHAAHEAGERFGEHSHLICLRSSSQAELEKQALFLERSNIQYQMFFEPDNNLGYTAICTQPLIGDQRKPLERFSLHT
jgi:hypothetical protein